MITAEQIQAHAATIEASPQRIARAAARTAIADRVVAARRDGLAAGRHRVGAR